MKRNGIFSTIGGITAPCKFARQMELDCAETNRDPAWTKF